MHISTCTLAPWHSCPPKAGLEITGEQLLNRGRFVPSKVQDSDPTALSQTRGTANFLAPHLLPGIVTEPLPYHNSTSTAAGAGGERAPARPLPMDYSHGVQFFQRAALSLGAPLRPRTHKYGSSTTVNPSELGSTRVAPWPRSSECHVPSSHQQCLAV